MLSEETYGKLLVGATGVKEFGDSEFLWHVGEKIFNPERMFNVREGLGRKDDAFPKRITDESVPEGPGKGQVFEAEPMLDEYYEARGWDKNGIPTKEKLNKLGLGFTLK